MEILKGYYNAFTQIVIVGFLAFCCPGIFNAMQGLGNAGSASAGAASAANSTLYACFAVFGYFGGAFFNIFGNKILMIAGGATYCFYAVAMYLAGKIEGLEWLTILAGAILGCGAGWFWTSQGAMMMAYSTPELRGRYIGVFWVIFNLGGMMGGLLTFGINFHSEKPEASAASYFTFVGIMAVGALGGVLLAPASKVIKEDRSQVEFEKAQSVWEEVKGAFSVATNKHMLLLTILFVSSNWFYTYQFGLNGALFNIRTRGINSAMYWAMQMFGAYVLGRLLDKADWSLKKRGLLGFGILAFEFTLAYVLGAIQQYAYLDGFEKSGVKEYNAVHLKSGKKWEVLDIGHSKEAGFPIFIFLLYGVGDAMLQTFAYWIMGALAGDDTNLCARYSGYYKGVQSAGAAIAWAIDTHANFVPQFWVCWALFTLSLPFTLMAIMDLKEHARTDKSVVVPTAVSERSVDLKGEDILH